MSARIISSVKLSVGSFDDNNYTYDSAHSPKLVFICKNCSYTFHVQSSRTGNEFCAKGDFSFIYNIFDKII
jgi:hypothetical protein